MAVDRELLELLRCPKCKGELKETDNGDGLLCEACALRYPVRDDIPVMLVDEAEKM